MPLDDRPVVAVRLARAWVRPRAGAPVLALLLGLLLAPALLPPAEVPPRPAVGTEVAPRGDSPAPVVSAAPPPPGRPSAPAPAGELPVLAAAWREAILQGQRDGVLRLAQALRGAPDGRAQLVQLAADSHPRVRAYALRELGRRRDPTLRPLFEAAAGDEAPPVRENAGWALGQLEGR